MGWLLCKGSWNDQKLTGVLGHRSWMIISMLFLGLTNRMPLIRGRRPTGTDSLQDVHKVRPVRQMPSVFLLQSYHPHVSHHVGCLSAENMNKLLSSGCDFKYQAMQNTRSLRVTRHQLTTLLTDNTGHSQCDDIDIE